MKGTLLLLGTLLAANAGPGAPPTDPGLPTHTRAPVKVVATLPIYASLAEMIGGAEVEATWIADPNEDAHFVRPKPSYALELRRADMFVTTGLDLELWVPALLDKAGNGDVLEGGTGYVTTYTGITLLDIPSAADRSQGDVHVYGNPHLQTDPIRTLQVARNITTGLKRVAPDRAAHFDAGLAAFTAETWERLFGAELVALLGGETLEGLAKGNRLMEFLAANEYEGSALTGRLGGWLAEAAPLRGQRIVCYHRNWSYFEERFGMQCAEFVETKPGIAPTPRHVARLIDLMEREGLSVVLAASYFDRNKVDSVARRGGATALRVPMQPMAEPGVDNYFQLVDLWIDQLNAAVR